MLNTAHNRSPKRKRGSLPLLRFVLPLLALAFIAATVRGDNWGRYDWNGFDNNLDNVLQKYLQKARQQPLDDLLKNLRDYNIEIDPDSLNLDFSKEQLKLVENLLKDLKSTGKIPEQRLDKLTDQLKEFKKFLDNASTKGEQLPIPPTKTKKPTPKFKSVEPPPALKNGEPLPDDFSRWAKEQLELAGESQFGEFFRDSPAFKQALRDIQQQMLQSDGKNDWRFQDWINNAKLPDWNVKLPDNLLDRLPEWTPPELPRMNVKLPHLPRLPAFRGRLPTFSAPSISTPGASAVGETVLWILIFAGCGFIIWQLFKRAVKAQDGLAKNLGPWPLDPRNIRTAADLIAAFEYLSMLRHGSAARSWNHVTIADNLAEENSSQRHAAGELAQLYAQARYAPPAELLTPQAVDTARKHLCSFAGVAPCL